MLTTGEIITCAPGSVISLNVRNWEHIYKLPFLCTLICFFTVFFSSRPQAKYFYAARSCSKVWEWWWHWHILFLVSRVTYDARQTNSGQRIGRTDGQSAGSSHNELSSLWEKLILFLGRKVTRGFLIRLGQKGWLFFFKGGGANTCRIPKQALLYKAACLRRNYVPPL